MNIFTPTIEKFILPKRFGEVEENEDTKGGQIMKQMMKVGLCWPSFALSATALAAVSMITKDKIAACAMSSSRHCRSRFRVFNRRVASQEPPSNNSTIGRSVQDR